MSSAPAARTLPPKRWDTLPIGFCKSTAGIYVCLLLAKNYDIDPYVGIPLTVAVVVGL
jgi:hypothetical protein